MLAAEFPGRNPGFGLAEDTDDLFVGKTLFHGDALMWLMKALLTSGCVNQWGAGQSHGARFHLSVMKAINTLSLRGIGSRRARTTLI